MPSRARTIPKTVGLRSRLNTFSSSSDSSSSDSSDDESLSVDQQRYITLRLQQGLQHRCACSLRRSHPQGREPRASAYGHSSHECVITTLCTQGDTHTGITRAQGNLQGVLHPGKQGTVGQHKAVSRVEALMYTSPVWQGNQMQVPLRVLSYACLACFAGYTGSHGHRPSRSDTLL